MNTPGRIQRPLSRDWSKALEAKRKKRAGGTLSPAEAKALKEYTDWNNARASTVYWDSPEELAAMKARAHAAGKGRFSDWCTTAIRRYASGEVIDPRIVGELTDELGRLRQEAERERDRAEEYRGEAREWSMRYRRLADELATRAGEKLLKEKAK